jgi:transketolase
MTGDGRVDLREVMVGRLIRAVEQGVNVAVLVADSTSTSLIGPFADRFPDRLVNVGIAEQNLLGMAAGMAQGGYVAVTANAAPFAVSRANEQLKNDICYSETNVKVVGLNAGVAYGALASTHHAIDDISILRGMGNVLILAPADGPETDAIFKFALEHVGPVYIRMDNMKFPSLHPEGYRFVPGAPDVLRAGRDLTVFSLGSVTFEAMAAARALAGRGIEVGVVNVPSIRPLDRGAMTDLVGSTARVLTVEEHSVHGGLGSLVAEIVAEGGLPVRLRRLGVPEGRFAPAGPRAKIREHLRIDAAGIEREVLSCLEVSRG